MPAVVDASATHLFLMPEVWDSPLSQGRVTGGSSTVRRSCSDQFWPRMSTMHSRLDFLPTTPMRMTFGPANDGGGLGGAGGVGWGGFPT